MAGMKPAKGLKINRGVVWVELLRIDFYRRKAQLVFVRPVKGRVKDIKAGRFSAARLAEKTGPGLGGFGRESS